MNVIEKLESKRDSKGQLRKYGLFLCPYCNKEVERRYHNGLRHKSCGCVGPKLSGDSRVTHGCDRSDRQTRLYEIWKNMKQRCYHSNNQAYKDYGGRDVRICDEWKGGFVTFKKWALSNGYRDNLTIDRINNNGNYKPSNCKWSTMTEQNRNRRNTKLNIKKANQIRSLYFIKGIERELLAKKFSVSNRTIWDIIYNKTWRN